MKYNPITRRHFLQGAGSSLLALPLLPSLMPKAHAGNLPSPKFMVMYWSAHGGIMLENQWPINTNPTIASHLQSQTLYSSQNHQILTGKLANLRTTRASNVPYLQTNLDVAYLPFGDPSLPPMANSYALDPSGADFDSGAARVTPIVGSFVSDTLLNKMNLVCGLDMMYYSGHTQAQSGNFANYAGTNPASASANGMTNIWVPTIDAVAASYPNFYQGANPVAPSVMLNSTYLCTDGMMSYFSCYPSSSGIVPNSNAPLNVGAAFNLLFGSLSAAQANPTLAAKKSFILNQVHADYLRVAKGAYGPGRRIGQADRSRFEEFIANIVSLVSGINPTGQCTVPALSAADTSQVLTSTGNMTQNVTLQHYNQLIVAAFNCGLTQQIIFGVPSYMDVFVPSGSPNPSFTDGTTTPDTHQAVFHMHNYADRQTRLVKSQRYYFQYGFYDLMQRLDAVAAPRGGTLLDQALMFWTQEAGFTTHNGNALPMIMAGGAGGFIKTGNYVDYRNVNAPLISGGQSYCHVGIPYNRFLGTVLQAMGVPPTFYELNQSLFVGTTGRIPVTSRGTVPGYGHPFQQQLYTGSKNAYVYDYQLNDMSLPLPAIT